MFKATIFKGTTFQTLVPKRMRLDVNGKAPTSDTTEQDDDTIAKNLEESNEKLANVRRDKRQAQIELNRIDSQIRKEKEKCMCG